jgi:hypothetical protein
MSVGASNKWIIPLLSKTFMQTSFSNIGYFGSKLTTLSI